MNLQHSKCFAMSRLRFTIKRDHGFTLIELFIALLVVAIIVGVAVPNFRDVTRRNRLTTLVNEFVTALQYARSEAIKRGTAVSLHKGRDIDSNGNCNFVFDGEWDDGWEIFVELNPDGIKEGDCGNILRVGDPFPESYTLNGNTPFQEYVAYEPNGRSTQAGSFVLCDNTDGNNLPESNTARMVVVSPTGRVRIADYGTNNIPLDADDNEITSCLSPFN